MGGTSHSNMLSNSCLHYTEPAHELSWCVYEGLHYQAHYTLARKQGVIVVVLVMIIADLWTSGKEAGRVAIQEVSSGRQPSRLGCMYTMPHLLTVAGDATAKSATSKIMFIKPDMATISPLFRHSFLLSSSTCRPTPGKCVLQDVSSGAHGTVVAKSMPQHVQQQLVYTVEKEFISCALSKGGQGCK